MRKKVDDSALARAALKHASSVNPKSTFLASCKDFFVEHGFLTQRQREALHAIRAPGENYPSSGYGGDDPYEDDYFIFGDDFHYIPNQD